ncbi:triphosphoribosyl-dephospho-CoA synthase CitG [Brenneria sp. MC1SB4.1]|uniref:Probable 2-(5''-triphosphoribosyl)-3'-dephosphocoenzyme-A synthase n=2 Tax=Brenneria tiliae TaxID=2914984 RepID=A0ABT0MPU6_9GAMM|nr:triphosphoribosyl-dephospho-CoA synthase CitG [Brenneria tiliae]MCL2891837.1 triphosphoribosyl-dephospho-CoA synthase CitG [Brenneria tiliae]
MPPMTSSTADIASILRVEPYSVLAWRAMLTEVNLTPKPGLVDRHNCGAHKDMSLLDFHRSAFAIRQWLPYFLEFGFCSASLPPMHVLSGIRPLGMACEIQMLRATAGVNTHKGTIFILGLLFTALGRLLHQQRPITPERLCRTVASFCSGLVARELETRNLPQTAGELLFRQLGLTGARGAAEAGYPLIIRLALPHYRLRLQQGTDPELALLDTLILLIAHNDDTNIASRGGQSSLRWIQQQAAAIQSQGGIRQHSDLKKIHQFDIACIQRNLSPGGSADLLIATWFLAQLTTPANLFL